MRSLFTATGTRPRLSSFAHPSLISFVQDLAARVARSDRVLLIADLGQPRGGPVSGHASHQLGLDADIRLLMLPRRLVTFTMSPCRISNSLASAG